MAMMMRCSRVSGFSFDHQMLERTLELRGIAVKLPIVLRVGEDGWIVAECPVIPGCISQGRTRDEALANIREAVELCLETRSQEGTWALPHDFEVTHLVFEQTTSGAQ
jgi:predicted RNase H-like HicB family nuclease